MGVDNRNVTMVGSRSRIKLKREFYVKRESIKLKHDELSRMNMTHFDQIRKHEVKEEPYSCMFKIHRAQEEHLGIALTFGYERKYNGTDHLGIE